MENREYWMFFNYSPLSCLYICFIQHFSIRFPKSTHISVLVDVITKVLHVYYELSFYIKMYVNLTPTLIATHTFGPHYIMVRDRTVTHFPIFHFYATL